MFTKIEDNKFKIIGEKKENIFSSLESKMHTLFVEKGFMGASFCLSPMHRYDDTNIIKEGIMKETYDYVYNFFDLDNTSLRKDLGMLNKLNIILKGNPGTGKTHLACTIAASLIKEYNGIGVVIDDIEHVNFPELIDNIRINDDPKRLVIIVLDEMEKNSHYLLKSSKFLGFLDGANSRENVIIISTVNEVDGLPDFLTNRPGRFEKIFNFVFNDPIVIKGLIENLIPKTYLNSTIVEDITKLALEKEISTIDHLRFLVKDYLFAIIKERELPKKEDEVISKIEITSDSKLTEKDVLEKLNKHLEKEFGEIFYN